MGLRKISTNDNREIDEHDKAEIDELRIMAQKQCILSLITIISTLITLIVVGLTGMRHVFGSIDANLSFLCIISMYRWNSKRVEKIFYCCLKQDKDLKMTETINY